MALILSRHELRCFDVGKYFEVNWGHLLRGVRAKNGRLLCFLACLPINDSHLHATERKTSRRPDVKRLCSSTVAEILWGVCVCINGLVIAWVKFTFSMDAVYGCFFNYMHF